MGQSATVNRQITLASRPHGAPTAENFTLKEVEVPKIKDGEVLLRSVYLSLDPYMRGRMSDAASYADPVNIGDPMVGGVVSRVVESQNSNFVEGDWILGYTGWQDYAVSDGTGLTGLGPDFSKPSYALGVLGMPGYTAYMGLLDIGKPKAGETIVVGSATGPVGATVGQIGKIKECRVVGVAGGEDKCRHAVEVLGFDACIDHKADNFAEQLAAACPDGVDVYYENIGGKVFQAVLPLFNACARMPVCGLIAHYNATELPEGPDRSALIMRAILTKRLTVKGFIIFDDYPDHYNEFAKEMLPWLASGQVKYKEQIVDGLENAPAAFMGLLEGENFGKLVVRIAND